MQSSSTRLGWGAWGLLGALVALGVSCSESSSGPVPTGGGGSWIVSSEDGAEMGPPDVMPPGAPEFVEPEAPVSEGGILDLEVVVLSPQSAEVRWRTAEFSTSSVLLDIPGASTVRELEGRPDRYHVVLLDGLSPEREYSYRALSQSDVETKVSATGTFTIPSPETPRVLHGHPRIFLTSEDLPELRRRVEGSHSRYWKSLTSYCESVLDDSPSSLAESVNGHLFGKALAFCGLVGRDARVIRKATEVALASAADSPTQTMDIRRSLVLMACAYDWLYPDLTDSTRAVLRSAILKRMDALHTNDREFLWGWNPEIFSPLTIGAIALYGEAAEAEDVLEKSIYRYRHSIFPAWRHFAATGGTMEGWWYSTFHLDYFLDAILALRSATNVDFLETETWLNELVDWFSRGIRGDLSYHRVGDSLVFEGLHFNNLRYALCMARHFRNPEAQWLAEQIRDAIGTWGPITIHDILLYDPDVRPAAPARQTARLYPEAGFLLASDGEGSDAVQWLFKSAREFTMGHTHRDNNSFTIFYKGGQALDSGVYDEYTSAHHMNYYERSIAHNTIVVYDPNETFRRYGTYYVNDGGQQYLRAPEDVEHAMPGVIEEVLAPQKGYQQGGIYHYESTADHVYALGDAGPSYHPDKVEVFDRHFLVLKSVAGFERPVTVIFDDVVATDPSFRKAYLLHTQNQPVVSGTMVAATHGEGMLFQQTVLPTDPVLQVVGGSGKEFWVQGQNYAPTRSPKPSEEAGRYRVEVSPAGRRSEDHFLHVLYATDAGSSAPLKASSVDARTMLGLRLADRIVLFPADPEPVEDASYPVGPGTWSHLLVGLVPEGEYEVSVDGREPLKLEASREGTLAFQTEGSAVGRVEVSLAP